ncbi:MAG: aconitase X catalytic domain-containing protein [Steroidobacteraceae bacterium]
MDLDSYERGLLEGAAGGGAALAMRVLVESARVLGAKRLVPIRSAHIDSCLYHGDSGTLFAERLVGLGARVAVPTTLNVGALDLLHAGLTRLDPAARSMAHRMMAAYIAMGARQTWTCAPYQAGHRPAAGEDVAWGESNAVAFCNSVLGARTNRYGDFLDICAAITARAPQIGLHLPENRLARILIDASAVPMRFWREDIAYPILGAWWGRSVGQQVAAIEGIGRPTEDQLKALGAAAASSGSVGLFHVIGVTPEAPSRGAAFGNLPPARIIQLDLTALATTRAGLSTANRSAGDPIDAVAIGSPHLSSDELRALDRLLGNRQCRKPLYACTGRHTLDALRAEGVIERLSRRGVTVVVDTCVVVTPVLPQGTGVLVTNSGKFAHYAPQNTGYDVVFASLTECIESAVRGSLHLDADAWHAT